MWPLTSCLLHHRQMALLYLKELFLRTQHIMPFHCINVKQNRLRPILKRREQQMYKCLELQVSWGFAQSVTIWNFCWPGAPVHMNEITNMYLPVRDRPTTYFAAHASSHLFLGRMVDRTWESGRNRPNKALLWLNMVLVTEHLPRYHCWQWSLP